MKEIYYKKVGRRYVPVSEYDSELLDAFPKGDHLVSVYPGGSSRRYKIDPNYAALIAAGRVAEEAIRSAIHRASEARPTRKELTPEQQRAWKTMQAAMGDDRFYVSYGSISDAVDAGMTVLQQEANKLMTHPAVQDAYNQFLTVCKMISQKA